MNLITRLRDWWRGWCDADLAAAKLMMETKDPGRNVAFSPRQYAAWASLPEQQAPKDESGGWLERWLARADERNSTVDQRNCARLGLGMYPEPPQKPVQIDARPLAKIRGWNADDVH